MAEAKQLDCIDGTAVFVDAEDYDRLSQFVWQWSPTKNEAFGINGTNVVWLKRAVFNARSYQYVSFFGEDNHNYCKYNLVCWMNTEGWERALMKRMSDGEPFPPIRSVWRKRITELFKQPLCETDSGALLNNMVQRSHDVQAFFSRSSGSREGGLPQVDEAEVKSIACVNGVLALVDPDVFERANQYRWYATKVGVQRVEPGTPRRTIYLHREVMGEPEGYYIGFVNGNKHDCRRENLFVFLPGKKREALAALKRPGDKI